MIPGLADEDDDELTRKRRLIANTLDRILRQFRTTLDYLLHSLLLPSVSPLVLSLYTIQYVRVLSPLSRFSHSFRHPLDLHEHLGHEREGSTSDKTAWPTGRLRLHRG